MSRERTRDRSKLAPSIRKAHREVLAGFAASVVHGVVLVVAALWLVVNDPGATVLLGLVIAGAILIPLLGRMAYHGNPFAGFLLLVVVVAPMIGVLLADWPPILPFAGLVFLPFYWQTARGATNLRGRRRSR
ncbi:MAG: hypothetical protein EA352_01405 [Gemmatimonadales bacterium]|nr:MAG: hypothetical protein EA352_01405 [Gemmatimonadales bacterium]